MKKFLSLALALIMTLSLVTISAGATEYKDLTDKNEIRYEEAVAVLNRLGIITGCSDGSFRPAGELTRGVGVETAGKPTKFFRLSLPVKKLFNRPLYVFTVCKTAAKTWWLGWEKDTPGISPAFNKQSIRRHLSI